MIAIMIEKNFEGFWSFEELLIYHDYQTFSVDMASNKKVIFIKQNFKEN